MKPPARHALHLAACLCGLVASVLASHPLRAQQEAAAIDAAPDYQDRLIGGGTLTPDISAGESSTG